MARRLLLLLLVKPPPHHRPYIAVNDNLRRLLNNDLTYLAQYQPPLQPPPSFRSFTIKDRPGEQWIRLKSKNPDRKEEIKIDATMFDGVAPAYEGEIRLHVSFIVEVTKGDEGGGSESSSSSSSDSVLGFICSAWPDSIQVQKVFPVVRTMPRVQPYIGRDFRELSKEMQSAVLDYLEEREVGDELAKFLHKYMANKDKAEILRWMKTVESFVQK